MIPEFAIIGHPNEGKSSVLSTLAEDDSVRVSATPGETRVCRSFPVIIDSREIIRFIDTPGFQNPSRVLSELKKLPQDNRLVQSFLAATATVPELHDDRELLGPVAAGAGIIYVVDGSRPVRNVDRAEMEILRLTGKPRMAVINCKADADRHLEQWKNAFRQNFNLFRVFNAHRATYAERLLLLEALRSIDQDWQQPLQQVVQAFKEDWAARNNRTAEIITELLRQSLSLKISRPCSEEENDTVRTALVEEFSRRLNRLEEEAHAEIRNLFKHNIFNYELDRHSILHEDLLSERTWQLLGLTRKQMVIAGGLGGAAVGAGLEVAAFGHGLGIFTLLGTAAGAAGAAIGGEELSTRARLFGLSLGGGQLSVGPVHSIDLLFVLLNRAFLFYHHVINWAHGRRDYGADPANGAGTTAESVTRGWSAGKIKICHDFHRAVRDGKIGQKPQVAVKLRRLVEESLGRLSTE